MGRDAEQRLVAQLAGGADDHGIHHELVPFLAALHIFAQPVPFAAGDWLSHPRP